MNDEISAFQIVQALGKLTKEYDDQKQKLIDWLDFVNFLGETNVLQSRHVHWLYHNGLIDMHLRDIFLDKIERRKA